MDCLITGGSGFIGRILCDYLIEKGWRVSVLTRNRGAAAMVVSPEVSLYEDMASFGDTHLFDVIINLAGESLIQGRWDDDKKKEILDSRVKTTKAIVEYIIRAQKKPCLVISGSAVGFYGSQGDDQLDENAEAAMGFSHDVCERWEYAASQITTQSVRVCMLRMGLVLHPSGGALKQMLMPFKFGLGGAFGKGAQWMSWIHMEDLFRLMLFLVEHPELEGPVNATSPMPVTNKAFSKTLGSVLGRPAFLDLPEFSVKMIFGEKGEELFLSGQRVYPQKLVDAGFDFLYPDLASALADLLDKKE